MRLVDLHRVSKLDDERAQFAMLAACLDDDKPSVEIVISGKYLAREVVDGALPIIKAVVNSKLADINNALRELGVQLPGEK
jgi:hypothetical protein